MKKKYLKELHDLHHEKNFSADMLRMAIECIFRRDYWETKRIQEPQDKNEWIDHCLLQDDLEDLENKLRFLMDKPETRSVITPF
tara:strand:+ start:480 stop:731 length:252 start_codon:yes stop_codon:yes gene_type:complete